MKRIQRIALVAIAILLGVGAANAQFRFGLRAGINVNKLHLSNAGANFDSDNRCGFTGGVSTEFQIPVIGLCFDASLMYSRMNSQINSETVNSDSKDFFNIPINIKYKIGLPVVSNIITPFIYTGPDFAFKLGGDKNVFKEKTFQCAWNVGLGVELIRHLQIAASYGFGINSIMEKANLPIIDNVTRDLKVKNNYWTITASYYF